MDLSPARAGSAGLERAADLAGCVGSTARLQAAPGEEELQVERLVLADDQLADMLGQQRGLELRECGGGGNCLFLSMADQVRPTDVAHAVALLAGRPGLARIDGLAARIDRLTQVGDAWGDMARPRRAAALRAICVAQEVEWLSAAGPSLDDEVLAQSDLRAWLDELFLDMAQELLGWGKREVQPKLREWAIDARRQFIAERWGEYLAKEAKLGTYAGTSEAWALGEALGRRMQLWGNDHAMGEACCVVAGQLQPYFELTPASAARERATDPIRVFQCWGGGHYNMLVPLET